MSEMSFSGSALASCRVRQRGSALFAVGSILYILAGVMMDRLRAHGYAFHYALLFAWIPFTVACIGFVECVSEAPCQRLGRTWAGLRSLQRCMIGAFIIVTLLVAIICIASFFLLWLT